ncbi:RASGEF1B isoform 11, partial [Pongo abelii]
EQQWKPSMYSSITPVSFPSPLTEKPIGKVRMNLLLSDTMIGASWLLFLFALSYFGEIIKLII